MNVSPNMPLQEFFDNVFAPAKETAGLAEMTIKRYRYSVQRIIAFTHDGVRLRDIDDTKLASIGRQLVEAGYCKNSSRAICENARVVLRFWNRERFEDQHFSPMGTPQFAERDIKGTLEQICVDHYFAERTNISAPKTVEQYARCLRLFAVFLGHAATPEDLTDRVVGKFLRWLVEVGGLKPVTANCYVKQIKALWNWCAKKRIVAEFPTLPKLKQPEPTPVAWTREEFQKLFAACQEQVGYVGPVLANLFWTAFYLVLWNSGERTGAMLALRWDWLDMKSGHLTVPGEYRKGRVQSMVYKLKPDTLMALKAICKPKRELVFDMGDRKAPVHYFYARHRELVKSSGLPFEKRKSGPQKTRRTFASFIERSGGNATKALKHRDRRVTEDSYLDPRITEVESENKKLFALDSMKGGGA